MKMKLFFRISVLVLCILMSLSSFADDKKDGISPEVIDWSGYNQSLETIVSTSPKIYLYAKGHNKFVTVGGRYGAQPILAEVGMNFYVEKIAADANDRYYIHSWVNNPTTSQGTGNADYLGVEPLMDTDQRIFLTKPESDAMKSIYLYVDRGINNTHDDSKTSAPDRIKWHIEDVPGITNGYRIYSTWKDNLGGYNDNVERNYYLSYYEAKDVKPQKKFLVVTTDKSQAETFYFIKIDDYLDVIHNQKKKYINVSGLVQDARFERNNKGIDGTNGLYGDYDTDSKNNVWQFRYNRSKDAYVFPNLQDNVEDLAYMTAWVGPNGSSSENQNGNYLIQKITGLKPGLYRVNCQGFYFNPGKKDDKNNTSFVFASQDYKDISNQTALKTILPADWDLMQNMTYSKPYPTAKQWNKDVVGWNLGNQFESSVPADAGESPVIGNPEGSIHAEEAWGNPVVAEAMIQAVKNAGFNAIRIPIRWQCHITNPDEMSIDPAWIARIKTVVDWCLKNGLKVIINAHNEKWLESRPYYTNQVENCNKLALLWKNIATEFANYDSRLAFAGTNEVHIRDNWGKPTAENLEVQNAYNQIFVDMVRATGGNNAKRHLILQTYVCNPWFGIENGDFIIPKDAEGNGNNYMSVEFHYYQPWSYAGDCTYDYWGDAYKDAGKIPAENEKTMTDFFDKAVNTWSNKGLGIVIGEWGVTDHYKSNSEKVHENMTYYCKFLTTEARTRGFSTFVWDNNQFSNDNGRENYGIFDRHKDMEVKASWILNGIFEKESGYKQTDGLNGSKQTDGVNGYRDLSVMHCVNAGKIFAESNPYEDKAVDSRKYDSSVAVLVKADKDSETGTLYIGAGKRANDGGYAFFDNFQLFYMGNKEWYLDATNIITSEFDITQNNDGSYTPSGINHNNGTDPYNYPVTYNIRRYFNQNKWESLILPCTLTGDQVKQTFGGDQGVKLSVFDKVEGTCVYFRAVNLDNEGIVAGTPYIIKVGKQADIESKNIEYTFPWGNDATVKVKGPIYQVKGVVPPTFTDDVVTTDEITTGGYKVQFQGYYYKPEYAPANAYVVNNGNMYHLTSAWYNFVGTSWYITIKDAKDNPAKLSFSFDGDSSTTAIENVTRQEDAAVQTDGFVYNLSGQRVGTHNNMSNLSSGIYIVAGKKVVVK